MAAKQQSSKLNEVMDEQLAPAVDVFNNVAVERPPLAAEETLPEDALSVMTDQRVLLDKRNQVSPAETVAEEPSHAIDPQQRRKLDAQIEDLYTRVAHELNDNSKDVAFALENLRHAQDILLEDVQRFEEALYSVFLVNQMLVKKQNLRRWSYTWGVAALAYALLWLMLLIAVVLMQVDNLQSENTALWFSALAGGLGGVVAILHDLSWHVSVRNDFDRQYIMKYLIQPILGLVLGGVIFLITAAGFLVLNLSTNELSGSVTGGVLAVQVLLGFIVGFRQQVIYDIVDRLVRRVAVAKPADQT